MHTVLFVFEFLGTTELLVVAVVALILFGPRKLPEIGRSVGRGIAEFKRASDDFKRTWEFEVDLEQRKPALDAGAMATAVAVGTEGGVEALPSAGPSADEFVGRASRPDSEGTTVARGAADEADEMYEDAAGENIADENIADENIAGRADSPARRAGEDEINAS